MNLAEQTCTPIKTGATPLSLKEAEALLLQIPAWKLGEKAIEREFHFKDFHQSMNFAINVAEIANGQDHHPDIFISYNRVRLTLSTHKIGGLSLNDFIVAAKIDLLAEQQRGERAA
jgi:4a-hydroxytetrahydrobiopterin dehydratase